MNANELIVSAVKNMAASISAILGTSAVETLVTVNDVTVFHEKKAGD